jgi:CMP/dCMP kinase
MTTITISRQFASGGDEIAYRLCQELGCRMFNKRMVQEAARASDLCEEVADDDWLDYSEDNHQVSSFLEKLFERMPVIPYGSTGPGDITLQYELEEQRMQKARCLRLMQKAIERAYQFGNIVIVGRGGQVVLRDRPNVIHVRVIAPPEIRCQRVKEQLKAKEKIVSAHLDHQYQARAKDIVAQRDAASADYIQTFYAAHWDDPLLYHLVLNTGKMPIEQAAQAILQLMHSRQRERLVVPG